MQTRNPTSGWQDVLAFLSLAAAAGLACGIALGGLALLLSAPAYGAEPLGTLVLRPLEPELDPYEAIRVAPVSSEAGFQIYEGTASARVVQTFRNPSGTSYGGIYAITLPRDATVEQLQVQVGERMLELEPTADILVGNVLALEIPGIGPLQTVVVELHYQEPLHDDGRFSSRFPMTTDARRSARASF